MAAQLVQLPIRPSVRSAPAPRLSVIVPAHGAERTLSQSVARILDSSEPDFELIVVDDASDTPVDREQFDDARVRVLRNPERRGAAYTRNRGAKAARGEVLLFVDADVYVRPGTLERALRHFDAPGVHAVTGLYDPDRPFRSDWSRFYNLRMARGILRASKRTDVCLSAIFAVRRELFLEIGGFNTRYLEASVEDIELGFRLYAQGKPIVADRELRVEHDKEFSLGSLLRNDFRRSADRVQFVLARRGVQRLVERRGLAVAPMGQILSALGMPLLWLSLALSPVFGPVWLLAALALLGATWALNADYLGFCREKGGLGFAARAALLLPIDLSVAFAGIVAGAARDVYRRGMRYASYLPHLRHFLYKRRPVEVTLFVTDACNAKCTHCFYHENLNRKTPGLLELDELAQAFRSMRPLMRVLVSGGEPFLRHDLAELIEVAVRESGARHITIPTNGLKTERTVATVEKMLARCPDTTINVSFSILGLEQSHDDVVKVPGGYRKLLETYRRLQELKRFFPNLLLGVIMTQSKTNQHEVEQAYDFVRNTLKPDNISFSLIRGASKEEEEMEVDIERYKRVIAKIKRDSYRGRFPFWKYFARHKQLLYDYVVKVFEQDRYFYPCFSGRLRMVITPEGQVYPCEILMLRDKNEFRMGNVRESGYDMQALGDGADARRVNRFIRDTKCYCRHECDMSTNLFFNPRMFLKFFRKPV